MNSQATQRTSRFGLEYEISTAWTWRGAAPPGSRYKEYQHGATDSILGIIKQHIRPTGFLANAHLSHIHQIRLSTPFLLSTLFEDSPELQILITCRRRQDLSIGTQRTM